MAEKVVIVTGAARGIGKAIAIELLEAGFFTALCSKSRRSAASLEAEISSFAGNFMVSSVDISVEEEVKRFTSSVAEKKGRVDVLINNAGVVYTGSVEETETEQWDEMMAVNARGTFLMVKHSASTYDWRQPHRKHRFERFKKGLSRMGRLLRFEVRRFGFYQFTERRVKRQGNKGVCRFARPDENGYLGFPWGKME